MKGRLKFMNTTNINYSQIFKNLYYHLYSNSNSSRAERIISDLSKLLLCKLADEKNKESDLLNKFIEEKLSSKETLLTLLQEEFKNLNAHKEGFTLNDDSLRVALKEIESINLHSAPAHIIGDAFQALIGPNIRGDKGQFFTPKAVVKCIVKLLDPKSTDIIMDPACGTAGFLAEAYAYILMKSDEINSGKLIGIDKDKDLSLLSSALLEILCGDNAKIINTNSLDIFNNEINEYIGMVDMIVTNPPFGSKIGITDPEILCKYEFGYEWKLDKKSKQWIKTDKLVKSQDPQILFIELCINLLKDNGKMGIVLPEGVFGNKGYGYVLQYLFENGKIIGLIDCPRTTFQPSTDVKTNILLYKKGSEYVGDKTTKVAIALSCGHNMRGKTVDDKGNKLPNDFETISESMNNDRWINVILNESYVVPRYYQNNDIQCRLKELGEVVSIQKLIDDGLMSIRKGHEIGSSAYGTGDIPFIRTSDINNLETSTDTTNSVSESIYERYSNLQQLKLGDILLVNDGRYRIGKTAIITEYNIKSVIQSHLKIISLKENDKLDAYELLYILNMKEVQTQIRNLVFVQSTIGTLGNRIKELNLVIPFRTPEWCNTIEEFKNTIEGRARLLQKLSSFEHNVEL